MPFTRLYYHLVWSTKNRLPMIALELLKSHLDIRLLRLSKG